MSCQQIEIIVIWSYWAAQIWIHCTLLDPRAYETQSPPCYDNYDASVCSLFKYANKRRTDKSDNRHLCDY